jgi:hypothetical protein
VEIKVTTNAGDGKKPLALKTKLEISSLKFNVKVVIIKHRPKRGTALGNFTDIDLRFVRHASLQVRLEWKRVAKLPLHLRLHRTHRTPTSSLQKNELPGLNNKLNNV